MTKNLRKVLSLLRAGRPITEARFPTNFILATNIRDRELKAVENYLFPKHEYPESITYGLKDNYVKLAEEMNASTAKNINEALKTDIKIAEYSMTEAEFHQAHSVEKEQV